MNDSPFKSYGFNFTMDGKEHAFDVVAASEDEAKRKVAAMCGAVFAGELHEAPNAKLSGTDAAGTN